MKVAHMRISIAIEETCDDGEYPSESNGHAIFAPSKIGPPIGIERTDLVPDDVDVGAWAERELMRLMRLVAGQ